MEEKGQTIAIYGLGEMAKEILGQAEGKYPIAGFLDGYRKEGEAYGKPVISMEEAIRKGVSVIIVAARPSSQRIIVNRIRKPCRENGIRLFDREGKEISADGHEGKSITLSVGTCKKELLEKIGRYEVISFDVFDTLLMRKVLYPEDVFGIAERMMPDFLQGKLHFARERQIAERELSRDQVPRWEEIYELLGQRNHLSGQEREELKRLEWEAENRLLLPRREMCQVFQYALNQGKKVYLVSDMYFSQRQMEGLLRQKGITGYEKLLVSCEYGTTKTKELFRYLYKEAGGKSILHIGDSKEADAEGAARQGIESVRIFSASELFWKSGLEGRLGRQGSLEGRVKLGMLAAELFNSPFVPEGGGLKIREPEELGRMLFGPIFTDFTLWLWAMVRENKEETLLFGARDGYLIKQLFDLLQKGKDGGTEGIYFLTSRMCASLAGIFTSQDIAYTAGMSFSGSFEEMLKARFFLTDGETAGKGSRIEDYRELILERAEENRENYLKYIRGLGLGSGKKAFFDFVSSGTCQLALEKLLGEKLHGYYFMRVPEAYGEKERLDIRGFYPQGGQQGRGGIYEDYFILENILASPKPSLLAFDRMGQPVYQKEDRTEDEIGFLERVHAGVRQYFEDYLEIWGRGIQECGKGEFWTKEGRELSEGILGLIHLIPVENEVFLGMEWGDGFYGRSAALKEMI